MHTYSGKTKKFIASILHEYDVNTPENGDFSTESQVICRRQYGYKLLFERISASIAAENATYKCASMKKNFCFCCFVHTSAHHAPACSPKTPRPRSNGSAGANGAV